MSASCFQNRPSDFHRPHRSSICRIAAVGAFVLLLLLAVTTASKVPVKATRTPAAIYVITQEDIRRSGATSIPEALRLAPGVEVAQVDSNTWSLGVRGFESTLSRSVL